MRLGKTRIVALVLLAVLLVSSARLPVPSGNVASAASSDYELLAHLIAGEARSEPYLGKVGVGAVVMNRLKNPRFPKTVAGVIYEPWAFTSVMDGQINLPPDRESYRAAQDALAGWDPTYGALYFYNPAKASSPWIFSRPITIIIGSHYFAR